MVQITLEEPYRREKYNIIVNAMAEYLLKSDLWQQDTETALKLLIVMHPADVGEW